MTTTSETPYYTPSMYPMTKTDMEQWWWLWNQTSYFSPTNTTSYPWSWPNFIFDKDGLHLFGGIDCQSQPLSF